MTSSVELASVSKRYGSVTAVNDVSLRIEKGEMLTLLGPSGCGKTTLLNMIAGFVNIDDGEIRIDGKDVRALPPHQRDLGVVFQNYAVFPHMSIAENVGFGLAMRRISKSEAAQRVGAALDLVRLSGFEQRRPSQLSGGQLQRVALARALVIDPAVLLLDEPLSALDKNLRSQMQFEIKDIQRRIGVTTICVTHDQGEALSMADRVAVLSHGVLQQVASPIDLYNAPRTAFVAGFVGDNNRLRASCIGESSGQVQLRLDGGAVISLDRAKMPQNLATADVTLFIRPERIEAVAGLPEGGAIAASTHSVVFQGDHVDIWADAEGVGRLLIRSVRHVDTPIAAGSSLALRIDWDRAHIFAAED